MPYQLLLTSGKSGGDPAVMFAVGPDHVGGTSDDPDLDFTARTAWAFVGAPADPLRWARRPPAAPTGVPVKG